MRIDVYALLFCEEISECFAGFFCFAISGVIWISDTVFRHTGNHRNYMHSSDHLPFLEDARRCER